MTLKELSQLYYLSREIAADQRRLNELTRMTDSPSSPPLSDMPRAPHSVESKVERLAAEIVDLQAIIAARQIQCIHERARLERWISDIPDSLMREIFKCRFSECMSWLEVAYHVGGNNTEGSVKMACYRYLRECGEEQSGEAAQPCEALARV